MLDTFLTILFSFWGIYYAILCIYTLFKFVSNKKPEDSGILELIGGIIILGSGIFIGFSLIFFVAMFCFSGCSEGLGFILVLIELLVFIVINYMPYKLINRNINYSEKKGK